MRAAHLAVQTSALLLGLFAGAMLLIGGALVPFWRALPPPELRRWFAVHAGRVRNVMVPLGVAAMLAALAALFVAPGPWLVAGAAAPIAVVVITALVNEPANHRFAAPDALDDDQTRAELERWRRWHWLRMALGVGGFWAALRALG